MVIKKWLLQTNSNIMALTFEHDNPYRQQSYTVVIFRLPSDMAQLTMILGESGREGQTERERERERREPAFASERASK